MSVGVTHSQMRRSAAGISTPADEPAAPRRRRAPTPRPTPPPPDSSTNAPSPTLPAAASSDRRRRQRQNALLPMPSDAQNASPPRPLRLVARHDRTPLRCRPCQWQSKTAHFWQLKTAHFPGGRLGVDVLPLKRVAAPQGAAVTMRLPGDPPMRAAGGPGVPSSGSCCRGCCRCGSGAAGGRGDVEHADLELKERAMAKTSPSDIRPARYRPDDDLLAFLNGL